MTMELSHNDDSAEKEMYLIQVKFPTFQSESEHLTVYRQIVLTEKEREPVPSPLCPFSTSSGLFHEDVRVMSQQLVVEKSIVKTVY